MNGAPPKTHRSRDGVDIDHKLAVEDRIRVVEFFAILMRKREPVDLVHVIFAVDLYVPYKKSVTKRSPGQQWLLRVCGATCLFGSPRTYEVDLLTEAGCDDQHEDAHSVRFLAYPKAVGREVPFQKVSLSSESNHPSRRGGKKRCALTLPARAT